MISIDPAAFNTTHSAADFERCSVYLFHTYSCTRLEAAC